MPTISYRANTLSQHFPFLTMNHGRTIIVPKQDQAFKSNVISNPSDDDKDTGIPQAYYMHNVMPNSEGLQSIGFKQVIAPFDPTVVDFDEIYILRDIDENRFLFVPAGGTNYIFDGNIGIWTSIPVPAVIASTFVTVAYINGHTYICYEKTGIFEYNSTSKTFDVVPVIGITVSLIKGITASNGFLIAWDDFNVFRSSGLNPLDFTPDITVGAGSSIPEDIKGRIVICLPVSTGFIIYTTANAVGATFTQNIRFPFQYLEINGSAGIPPPRQVPWQYNSTYHYVWTRAGLQKVDKSSAIPVFGDVTDFLSQKIFEDYNDSTDTFTVTNLTSDLLVKIALAEKRFFVISYGITSYTHAIIYDLIYKRWGKIKINHVAAFEFFIPSVYGDITWNGLFDLSWDGLADSSWSDLGNQVLPTEHAKETLAFLQADGTIKVVNFELTQLDCSGVAILGKYQYIRERLLQINEIEVNSIPENSNFSLKILSSFDGTTLLPAVTPFLAKISGKFRKYLCDSWGKNHSIVAKGSFDLSSILLTMNLGYKA
jgi:hypothetical protein